AILGLKLNISAIAMPMLVFGIVLYLQTNRSLKGIGNILSGLGFFFFGIALMKAGFEAYQDSLDLTVFTIEGLWGEIVFLLFGIVITVVLQSSSASMAIILTALAAGQISYLNAMTLAIGANVGTTITAIIGAIASNVNGKRIAVAHLLFNVITGIIALIFLNQLEWIVDRVAFGLNISQQDYTLKLAIFHTAFNLLGIIVMRPFVLPMVKFLNKYLKDKTIKSLMPKYLNDAALAYPQSALQVMLKETEYLFVICFEAIAHGLGLSRTTVMSKEEMKTLSGKESIKYEVDINEIYYNRIKVIYGKILKFGTRAQKNFSDAKYFHTINDIMEANRYFIEVVKDVKDIQPNVLKYCESDNEIIRNEYNKIRKRIAKFIRL
ncbi:MAG: Na/Pi cotransporter family protein, partial [Cyclobacteriaceae bacterium]|nr:Na/Pi cotransporter family protein [Cyclobacteriaceae bacterium]